jgi:5-methyltetrahydropteroyltriglutamate--homocysteine methyltransferase
MSGADLLATTVVGSYPQPAWLVDREVLLSTTVPRVRMRQIWRVAEPYLVEAQDDATRLAIYDMERAGVDIVSDGEIRRESYFNQFATALDGIDLDHPGTALDRLGRPTPVPRVVGPIRRTRPVQVRDAEFLRRHTDRRTKVTLPGPFTLSQLAQDEHYRDPAVLAMAYADVVNEELRELKATGVDVLQLDEPYLQALPEAARTFGVEAINRALAGISGPTVIHVCFGYAFVVKQKPSGYSFLPELERAIATQVSIETAQPRLDLSVLRALPSKTIVLGVLDLADLAAEPAEAVAARIRAALAHVAPERLLVAPDCGMKYLPRATALAKLEAMVAGATRVRAGLQ